MESSLSESGNARPEGKRGNLDVLDFRVRLLEAAGDRLTGNSAGSGGTAKFFFFDGGDNGIVVHQNNRGIAAKGPDAEGEHRLSVPRSSISFEKK